jgi:hypothetical protein
MSSRLADFYRSCCPSWPPLKLLWRIDAIATELAKPVL